MKTSVNLHVVYLREDERHGEGSSIMLVADAHYDPIPFICNSLNEHGKGES